MIQLSNAAIAVAVDPCRGGAVTSIRDLAAEVELLFQAPWRVVAPPTAPVPPDAWTSAWPGGWHPLVPNAGEPCRVDGREHGFHGAASVSAWQVEHQAPSLARISWRDEDGLTVTREVRLEDHGVRVDSTVVNTGPAETPFVFVEHLILGPPLVGDDTRLELPHNRVLPLADSGETLLAPELAAPWPHVTRDEVREDWSTAHATPFSRFGALLQLDRPTATVVHDGMRVRLDWSGETLPYAWLWHENGASREMPEQQVIRCLGLEPASVPTSEGLQRARSSGLAAVLAPGERWASQVALTVSASR